MGRICVTAGLPTARYVLSGVGGSRRGSWSPTDVKALSDEEGLRHDLVQMCGEELRRTLTSYRLMVHWYTSDTHTYNKPRSVRVQSTQTV